MSTSSSSECNFEECYQYYNESYQGTRFASTYSNPFYPTMGHPLIYCAQIPPGNRKQRSKKNNPNCFVKAFRWYTQEHVSSKRNEYCTTDMPGFAHWLDTKYDEFVKSSQMDRSSYKLKQTSTLEASKTPTIFSKKRHSFNEQNHVKEKELQSFEYIMQPKELVRPSSECCHTTPTCCCGRSNVTLTSTDTGERKTTVKSQSLSSISKDNREPIDLLTIHEGAVKNVGENKLNKNKSEIKLYTSKSRELSKSDTAKKSSLKNNFCQCPEDKVTNVDVGSQYESTAGIQNTKFVCEICAASCIGTTQNPREATHVDTRMGIEQSTKFSVTSKKHVLGKTSYVICECSEENVIAVIKADVKCRCQRSNIACGCSERNIKTESQTQCRQDCNIYQETDKIRGMTLEVTSNSSVSLKHQCPCTAKEPERCNRTSNAIQTSDHSIHLENETDQDYPLFMKIIYAEKLNEERSFCRCTL